MRNVVTGSCPKFWLGGGTAAIFYSNQMPSNFDMKHVIGAYLLVQARWDLWDRVQVLQRLCSLSVTLARHVGHQTCRIIYEMLGLRSPGIGLAATNVANKGSNMSLEYRMVLMDTDRSNVQEEFCRRRRIERAVDFLEMKFCQNESFTNE